MGGMGGGTVAVLVGVAIVGVAFTFSKASTGIDGKLSIVELALSTGCCCVVGVSKAVVGAPRKEIKRDFWQ